MASLDFDDFFRPSLELLAQLSDTPDTVDPARLIHAQLILRDVVWEAIILTAHQRSFDLSYLYGNERRVPIVVDGAFSDDIASLFSFGSKFPDSFPKRFAKEFIDWCAERQSTGKDLLFSEQHPGEKLLCVDTDVSLVLKPDITQYSYLPVGERAEIIGGLVVENEEIPVPTPWFTISEELIATFMRETYPAMTAGAIKNAQRAASENLEEMFRWVGEYRVGQGVELETLIEDGFFAPIFERDIRRRMVTSRSFDEKDNVWADQQFCTALAREFLDWLSSVGGVFDLPAGHPITKLTLGENRVTMLYNSLYQPTNVHGAPWIA